MPGFVRGARSAPPSLQRRSRATEVLEQKLLRQLESSIGQDYRLSLAMWIQNPSALVQKVHHAPIESFPDAGAIMERERKKTEGDLGELPCDEPIRDFGVFIAWSPGQQHEARIELLG